MQIVFQDPYGAFNPRMTIGGIIAEALELRSIKNSAERAAETDRLLTLVQCPAIFAIDIPMIFRRPAAEDRDCEGSGSPAATANR